MNAYPYVHLATTISDQDILRGSEAELLERAQSDKKFGKGFYKVKVSKNKKGNVDYALLHHHEFMVVVFPGSRNREDWMSERGNLMISRVRKLGGKVHKGFSKQVDSFWKGPRLQLKKRWGIPVLVVGKGLRRQLEKRHGVPVVLVGHSRGGACAVISGLWIERSLGLNRIKAVVTFGQPACVNDGIATRIDERWGERYLRIVTSTDPVPVLLKEQFSHGAGKVWFFDKPGNLRVDPTSEVMDEAIHRDNPAKQTDENDSFFTVVVAGLRQVRVCLEGHQHSYYHELVHSVPISTTSEEMQVAIDSDSAAEENGENDSMFTVKPKVVAGLK